MCASISAAIGNCQIQQQAKAEAEAEAEAKATIPYNSIIGIVKENKYERNRSKSAMLKIKSSDTGVLYTIECPYFCPVRTGDVIAGLCVMKPCGTYVFIREPVAEPSSSKEQIKQSFYAALAKQKPTQRLIDNIYDFFEKEAITRIDEKEDLIYRNRDSVSTATLEVISNYAYRFTFDPSVIEPLMNIMSKSQAEAFLRWWYRSHTLRRLYLLGLTKKDIRNCSDIGITPGELYYKLLENPYSIEKVPIDKAQSIAIKYGLSYDQNVIECAQIIRLVDELINTYKWICCPLNRLANTKSFPNIMRHVDMLKTQFNCSVRYDCLYLNYLSRTEDILYERLNIETSDEKIVQDCFITQKTKDRLFPEQLQAVKVALSNDVSIITGCGGTGKTTVIAAIVDELKFRNRSYMIASYTGKAVARIKEIVKDVDKIKTLHMLLASKSSSVEYLIIDEASMVPNILLARVLSRYDDVKIIFVGDPNQVQPIDCGDLFNQLLISGKIPVTKLTVDRRKKKQSILWANTNSIVNPEEAYSITIDEDGVEEREEYTFQWGDDCLHISGGAEEVENLIKSLAIQGVNPDKMVIISPFNRDLAQFNQCCIKTFLPANALRITDQWNKTWLVGSRVMMTSNRYDIMVMNGEEGKITNILHNKLCVEVAFGNGKVVEIPTYMPITAKKEFNNDEDDVEEPLTTQLLELSYAITVHKSQGSEWDIVIFYLSSHQGNFVNRNLTYTAISRAKEQLYVISESPDTINLTLGIYPYPRFDNLAKRLQNN